jgi:hypothetical protein
MPRGGSKPGQRRGGRKPGTPNKPKGERALIALEQAESEVRVLILAGDKITALGKDRLAEIDEWAYSLAKEFAPKKDEKTGKKFWENDGDEARLMRFLHLSAKCALGRSQFESPRLSAIAAGNLGNQDDDDGDDPHENLLRIIQNWIEAEKAEKAEKMVDVTPSAEPEPAAIETTPNPDDDCDGELVG